AYSRLRHVLHQRDWTVLDLHRQIRRAGHQANLKSLYRLGKEHEPLERLDLRLAGIICQVCRIPLSDLIVFAPPKTRLRRMSVTTQRRLDTLMARNNEGQLSSTERKELRALVREAEELTLHNARILARQRVRVGAE